MQQRKLVSRYDAIIVGSGIAGLLLAIELDAAGMRTALICKGRLMDSNTSWAQGGVAICTGSNPLDDPELHLKDTLSAGAGLCEEHIARGIVEGGRELFERLESLGLQFDRNGSKLELAREGGHSQARVLHSKDASGKAIAETLIAALRSCKKIAIFEHMFAYELIMHEPGSLLAPTGFQPAGRCVGIKVLQEGKSVEILAPRVVLCSGGLGQVFERTTNPSIATGDGIAMAYRAGAELVDMEFVQFHPTALYMRGAPASLITEAARGSGAILLDKRGERFAFRFHKDGELATRDVVSRAILTVMQEQDMPCVRLDMRPMGARTILEKYPNVVQSCRNWGIDPLDQPIPVSPAAHYFMGGIWTDDCGRSSVPGLYALGECASNGLHGANRLASNSLLEGGVMAMRVARAILAEAPLKMPRSKIVLTNNRVSGKVISLPENIDAFRKQMFSQAGLLRSGQSLSDLLQEQLLSPSLPLKLKQKSIESANLGLLGTLIARSALARCESRGAHFRSDYPEMDNQNFRKRHILSLAGASYRELYSSDCPASCPFTVLSNSFDSATS